MTVSSSKLILLSTKQFNFGFSTNSQDENVDLTFKFFCLLLQKYFAEFWTTIKIIQLLWDFVPWGSVP